MKTSTATVVGVALVGGVIWWLRRSAAAAAAAAAAPATGTGRTPVAEFLGISELCVNLYKVNMQFGAACVGIESAIKVFHKSVDVFKGCDGEKPSEADLLTGEAKNRVLNGPCRAYSDEWAWMRCPNSDFHRAGLKQVTPSVSGTLTHGGLCVSYANGCSPLWWAPANAKCKPGTKKFGRSTFLAPAGRYDRKPQANAGANKERLPVDFNLYPEPFRSWFRGSSDVGSSSIGTIVDALRDAMPWGSR